MMKEDAGKSSPRPNLHPPLRVAGSRAEVGRGDPGYALPSRAKPRARVLRGHGRELGPDPRDTWFRGRPEGPGGGSQGARTGRRRLP